MTVKEYEYHGDYCFSSEDIESGKLIAEWEAKPVTYAVFLKYLPALKKKYEGDNKKPCEAGDIVAGMNKDDYYKLIKKIKYGKLVC